MLDRYELDSDKDAVGQVGDREYTHEQIMEEVRSGTVYGNHLVNLDAMGLSILENMILNGRVKLVEERSSEAEIKYPDFPF